MGLGRDARGAALDLPGAGRIWPRSTTSRPRGRSCSTSSFDDAVAYYEQREQAWGEIDELPRNIERWIVLQVMDTRWREHLDNMEYFRQGMGLRGYAQKDPLVEYRSEGTLMFERDERADQAGGCARTDARRGRARVRRPEFEQQPERGLEYQHADAASLEAIAAG